MLNKKLCQITLKSNFLSHITLYSFFNFLSRPKGKILHIFVESYDGFTIIMIHVLWCLCVDSKRTYLAADRKISAFLF